ncbi:MAG TPA: LysE family transporter [Devosia sp.]|jgi:threonine/homoserine/homoserine lactone efflux protein|nr:LysE family transporter [Devosia sp.]
MFSAYFAAMAAVIAAQASPGPNMMAVAGAALKQGRGAALLVVAGIASGSLVWAVATAFGLGTLFRTFPQLLTALTLAGGAYLLWLGARSLRSAWRGGAAAFKPNDEALAGWAAWRRGLLVVLINPKAALMWSAIATFLFGAGLPMMGVLGFGPVVATSALLIYGAYGFVFSSRWASAVYQRFSRGVEFVFGAAFGCLGTLLIVAGVRALRA